MSKVMVYGSGAREHALLWRLAQCAQVSELISVGGSPAWTCTGRVGLTHWPESRDFGVLARDAKRAHVSLLVVGPDQALADGIADAFVAEGVPVFGPTKSAARIESSKSFAKELMQKAGIPTADHVTAQDPDEARRFLKSAPWGHGWVLKADGLALGKGVIVPDTLEQALAGVAEVFRYSKKVVIEERLLGQEVSWFALVSGRDVMLLTHARDYKREQDGDVGPNTGGMGAISPSEHAVGLEDRVRAEIFVPMAAALAESGTPFCGLLYAGLMVGDDRKPKVLEFNARFGDPEAQVVLPRLNGDFYSLLLATATGGLAALPEPQFTDQAAVYVVGAAKGYPVKPVTGTKVAIVPQDLSTEEPKIFVGGVAGSATEGFTVKGGRVLGGLGLGPDVAQARARAYSNLLAVEFQGMKYRTDIGK